MREILYLTYIRVFVIMELYYSLGGINMQKAERSKGGIMVAAVIILSLAVPMSAAAEDDWNSVLDEMEILLNDYIKIMKAYSENPESSEIIRQYVNFSGEYVWYIKRIDGASGELNIKQLRRFQKILDQYQKAVIKYIC
jgi:hypothetical protein